MTSSNIADSKKQYKLPPGSWDSHVHVVDEEKFPFDPDHPYRPKKADLDDLLTFERSLGADHVCLVCMSVYGNDNRSLLDALARLKGRGRGVVSIDPATITDEELDLMHQHGVRGVRLNLKTTNKTLDKENFVSILDLYASKIRSRGWAIQIFLALPQLPLIAEAIPRLGVPVVIDHLGYPDTDRPPSEQPGFPELMKLLENQQMWIKLSGTDRFPELPALDSFVRKIMNVAPTQIVWASDWPHAGGVERNPNGNRLVHQDYVEVDDLGFVEQCLDWCNGNEDLMRMICVSNPRRLWQYED